MSDYRINTACTVLLWLQNALDVAKKTGDTKRITELQSLIDKHLAVCKVCSTVPL